jgi:Fic family protein
MADLLEWTRREMDEKNHHPLIVTAIFLLRFLAIHPFQDGNGRLSRILTTLLLLKNGYLYVPYSSLEHVIELNKENYYLALRRSQKPLGSAEENLNPWLEFFFQSLKTQKDSLSEKIKKEKLLLKQPELSQKILELAKHHGSLNNSMIQSATGANRNTIKVHLKKLVEGKWMVQHGTGKGTRYSLS